MSYQIPLFLLLFEELSRRPEKKSIISLDQLRLLQEHKYNLIGKVASWCSVLCDMRDKSNSMHWKSFPLAREEEVVRFYSVELRTFCYGLWRLGPLFSIIFPINIKCDNKVIFPVSMLERLTCHKVNFQGWKLSFWRKQVLWYIIVKNSELSQKKSSQ